MDETTKILIGTISGFIIAFFAEPVKTYFTNKSSQNRLRKVLYHEVYENLIMFKDLSQRNLKGISTIELFQRIVQKDGYEYAHSNEITVFYQLREAIIFNKLYLVLKSASQYETGHNQELLKETISTYIENVDEAFRDKELDRNFMRRAIGKKEF